MKQAAIIGVAVALAGMAGAASTKPAGVSMAPESLVAARRAGMMMSASTFGGLRAQANADDLKRASRPAQALNAWAKAIPALFAPGSNVSPTEALPAVWTDRAGFETAAQTMATATDALAPAATANDKAAYAAALDQVGKACSGCHDKYRKPDERH